MNAPHRVGLGACATLVAANMVGTGVFTSLGFQVGPLPSPFVILVVWALGGLVALCGALTYAELAAALPRSGGEYHFLSRIFHPAVGFAAGLISVVVGFAAPVAIAAMALGSYLEAAWPGLPGRPAAFAVVLAVAGVHAIAVRASGLFQIAATALKAALIAGFLVLGFSAGNRSGVGFLPAAGDGALIFSPSFAVALMFVLYAYSGWNAAAYIIDEIREPQRTVPRALMLATLVVTMAYIALNAVFLLAEDPAAYKGKVEVAEIAATALFGPTGGRFMAGLIGLGLVASISAMTWAGPRVAQVAGRDFPLLRPLGNTSPSGIPRTALALQTGLALLYLATGTFENVLVYSQFALFLCGFLTVGGCVVLRVREPHLDRPFRCPAYPLPPLLFLIVGIFTLAYTAWARPLEAAAGAAIFLAGLCLYPAASRGRRVDFPARRS